MPRPEAIPQPSSGTNPFRSVEQSRARSHSRFGGHEQWLLEEVDRLKPEDYKPILTGRGGEHLVFEVPVRPNPDPKKRGLERVRNIVVKINLSQTLDHLSYADVLDPERTQRGIDRMDAAMAEREGRIRELREHFGHDAVPAQRFFIEDVPVSREIILESEPDWLRGKGPLPFSTIPAWVEIQRRVDLDPDQTVSLTGVYLEDERFGPFANAKPEEAKKKYIIAHEVLTGSTDLSPEMQQTVALEAFPTLRAVARRMQDPAFAEALRDLAKKLITYAERTQDAMDLMGSDNLVLTKTTKGWTPKLLDVLHIEDFTFDDIGIAVRSAKDGKQVSSRVVNGVYNAMNTVRVINALAILAGIPDRLRVEEIDEASAAGWKQMLSPPRSRKAA